MQVINIYFLGKDITQVVNCSFMIANLRVSSCDFSLISVKLNITNYLKIDVKFTLFISKANHDSKL